jgi:Protein ChrB, N-terminal
MEQTWLVFIPQLPSSPSSLRVLVWRRMRAAGAAALQQGVWVLPQTPEHEQCLRDVLREAQQQGGSGILLVATPLDADRASEVVERFRADRDEEYREFGVQRHVLTATRIGEDRRVHHSSSCIALPPGPWQGDRAGIPHALGVLGLCACGVSSALHGVWWES